MSAGPEVDKVDDIETNRIALKHSQDVNICIKKKYSPIIQQNLYHCCLYAPPEAPSGLRYMRARSDRRGRLPGIGRLFTSALCSDPRHRLTLRLSEMHWESFECAPTQPHSLHVLCRFVADPSSPPAGLHTGPSQTVTDCDKIHFIAGQVPRGRAERV